MAVVMSASRLTRLELALSHNELARVLQSLLELERARFEEADRQEYIRFATRKEEESHG